MSRTSRPREIIPVSYAARAKNMPEEPAINVLSRSKNAAPRGDPPSGEALTAVSDLQDHRVALTPARADGGAAVDAGATAQLVHDGSEDARAGGADRVPERDGAAVDVDPLLVDAEHADRVERDGRECLVDLPQVDVARLQPCLL